MPERGALLENRYRIVDVLGRGGMSTVYLAEDLRLPGSLWAVKELVCYEEQYLSQARESFEREAAMLSALRHPNLPVIVDFFTAGDKAYLVMEYVRGKTLLQLFEEAGGRLPVEKVTDWALQCASVLDFLHNLKPPVVFRDVKPANIMQSEDGSIKLIDFGLARCFDPRKAGDTFPAASWGFASPEQLADLTQTDPRSDIYSWGATCYFLLTGKLPLDPEVRRPIGQLNPDVPEPFAATIDRALHGARDERFRSFRQIIEELGRTASPRRGARRRPSPWMIAAVLLLLAMSLLLVRAALLNAKRAPSPSSTVRQDWEDSKERGDVLAAGGRYAEAVEEYAKSLTRRPQNGEVHIRRENAMLALMGSRVVTVGLVLPLTGFGERAGSLACRGAALAQEEINGKGGIGGKKVSLALRDDRSTIKESIKAMRALAADPSVCCAIGPLSLRQVHAVAPIVNEGRLPLISPTASSPDIFEQGQYVFSAANVYGREVEELARLAARRGGGAGIGILLNITDEFSQESSEAFARELRARGVRSLPTVDFQNKTEDFAPCAAELKKLGVQGVFFSGYMDAHLVKLCRALKEAGLPLPVYCLPMALDEELPEADRKAIDGVIFASYFSPFAPEAGGFVGRYEKKFKSPAPQQFAAETYNAARLVFSAIEGSGGGRRELRARLQGIGTTLPAWRGIMGSLAPSRGCPGEKVHFLQLRDGALVPMSAEDGPPVSPGEGKES